MIRAGVILSALLFLPASPHAVTRHVPSQFPTIQSAVSSAGLGDTILVECGTYYEQDIVLKPGIVVRSAAGQPKCATIDGLYGGRLFICEHAQPGVQVEGFTLTGGSGAPGGAVYCVNSDLAISHCIFSENFSGYEGGGVYAESSFVSFASCDFRRNLSDLYGGGMCCWGCSLVLTGCTFSGNSGTYLGGGLAADSATLTECIFTDNTVSTLDYWSSPLGGGAFCRSCSVHNCEFRENSACGGSGGGLACQLATLDSCVFFNNLAGTGGALYCSKSSVSVTNCTLAGNAAGGGGTGIYSIGCTVDLLNTLIAFGTGGEAVSCEDSGIVSLTCCDVYGNADGDWRGCIEAQYGINGNVSEDPLFCDFRNENMSLCEDSPCLPANNSCGVLIGTSTLGECECPRCEVLSVPNDYPTIERALAVAFYCDTVLVYPGTYAESVAIPSGVVLKSVAGPDSTVIDGGGADYVVSFTYALRVESGSKRHPAALEGFTITGGTQTGILSVGCSPVIANCVITGNSTSFDGGGIVCLGGAPQIVECLVVENCAEQWGGGIFLEDSSPVISQCTVCLNRSTRGGGISAYYSSPTIEGTVIAFNTGGEGVLSSGDGGPTLTCCDVYGNEGGDWVDFIEDQFGRDGNFSMDPMFCDMGNRNLELCPQSPCLAENNECDVTVGALGAGVCPCPSCDILSVPDEYESISSALAAAKNCDTVLVHPGTYTETIDIPWGVTIRSVAGPESTTIDGQGTGTVVHFGYDQAKREVPSGGSALLEGFTIAGGSDSGVRIIGSNPTIAGCVVTGNSAQEGGGAYCRFSSPTFIDCVFRLNEAAGHGGGLFSSDSSPEMRRCVFAENHSGSQGGGICCRDSRPTVVGCVFQDNAATERGGGMLFQNPSYDDPEPPRIVRCVFVNNSASRGGGLECGTSEIDSCTFYGNSASRGGGLWCMHASSVLVENTIVAFSGGGGAVNCEGIYAHADLACCNIYGNAGGDWVGCIENQREVDGNMSEDPLFCDTDSGRFALDELSPCGSINNLACGQIGAFGVECGSSPPELALGVLQNPFLTQYLDLYLVASEALDSSSVLLQIGGESLTMTRLDEYEHVWMADYEVAGSADSVTIRGCASDLFGNNTCVTPEFSATYVDANRGAVVASPDGRVRLIIEPDVLSRDAYVLILPVRDDSHCMSTLLSLDNFGNGGEVSREGGVHSYQVSPVGVSGLTPIPLEFDYAGTELEGEAPDQLYVLREGHRALESFTDPTKRTLTAYIREFGTFCFQPGPRGSSRVLDPRFLSVTQNVPNPFGFITTIRFEVRSRQFVDVSVFDVSGRRVDQLLHEPVHPGTHEILWRGESASGVVVAPGVYFCRVQTEHNTAIRKMLRIR